MAINHYFEVFSNDGSTTLFTTANRVNGDTIITVTETGLIIGTETYTYSGTKKFVGVSFSENSTSPDRAIGESFDGNYAYAYIVEAEATTSGVTVEYNGSVVKTIPSGNKATLPIANKKMKTDIVITVPLGSGGGSGGESGGGDTRDYRILGAELMAANAVMNAAVCKDESGTTYDFTLGNVIQSNYSYKGFVVVPVGTKVAFLINGQGTTANAVSSKKLGGTLVSDTRTYSDYYEITEDVLDLVFYTATSAGGGGSN
jgi:hypothetical protein